MNQIIYIIFESYYNLIDTFDSIVFVYANYEEAFYKCEELIALNKDTSINYYIQEWDVR